MANEIKPDLALIRTDLANERTLLAYGRTALMVAGTGVSLIQFFPDAKSYEVFGWVFIVVGVMVGAIGVMRFTRLQRRLRQ